MGQGVIDSMDTFDLDIASAEFTRSAIYLAIRDCDHHKVLAAIQAEENVHLRDHEFNSTYLHLIVNLADVTTEDKFVPMIYQLSNADIEVNAVDYKGNTALDLAIARELMELMVALLRVGIDPSEKDYKQVIRDYGSPFEYEIINTLEKYEPGMWKAVRDNDQGLVHMLANSWCRVNITKNGVNMIQYARNCNKSPDMISILEDYGPTLEFVHATLAGDERRMLELLMDSKPCDPNMMDISHQERWSQPLTPRSLRDTAIAMGHTHLIHLLPEAESSPDASILTSERSSSEPASSQVFRVTRLRSKSLGDGIPHHPPAATDTDTLKLDQRCYYFHEVDSFVHPYTYVSLKKSASIQGTKRQSRYRDYTSPSNYAVPDSKTKVKSKMCAIS